MNRKDESTEKLDVESLIVDLLACGLGGVVILFFIFSIKIIGAHHITSKNPANSEKRGKNPGFVSMIGDDGKSKKMGSIRIIRLFNLSPDLIAEINNSGKDPTAFWSLHGFKDDLTLLGTLRMQIQQKQNEILYFLAADGMREVTFSFPTVLKKSLLGSPGQKVGIEVIFIEGSSVKGDFATGMYSKQKDISVLDLRTTSIKLKIGKVAKIDRLIEFSTANKY